VAFRVWAWLIQVCQGSFTNPTQAMLRTVRRKRHEARTAQGSGCKPCRERLEWCCLSLSRSVVRQASASRSRHVRIAYEDTFGRPRQEAVQVVLAKFGGAFAILPIQRQDVEGVELDLVIVAPGMLGLHPAHGTRTRAALCEREGRYERCTHSRWRRFLEVCARDF
jgi:hypothetical protein